MKFKNLRDAPLLLSAATVIPTLTAV